MISATRSSSTSTSPISLAGPQTTLSHPGGRPASVSSSARRRADSGVWEAGFSTTAHPAASAGATLCATRLKGKLKGEIAPTTPMGRRSVNASLPAPAGDASIGTTSPASLRASTAAIVNVETARDASTRAAFMGLPASAEIVRATSSARSSTSRAVRSRIAARSCAGSGSAIARSAASIALVVSAAPPFATRPTSEPSYGERTSSQSPVSTHSPPMRSFRSIAVVATRLSVVGHFRVMDVPDVRYARVGRVAIAYQLVGDGPQTLVFSPQISDLVILWLSRDTRCRAPSRILSPAQSAASTSAESAS